MKNIIAYAFLAATVAAAPKHHHQHHHHHEDPDDEDCKINWITVYEDSPTGVTSSAAPVGTVGSMIGGGQGEVGGSEEETHEKVEAKSKAASATMVSIPHPSAYSSPPSSAAASTGGTADESSALSLPKLPNGEAAIPINDNHVAAPEDKTPVPEDVAIYTPKTANEFDNLDFSNWMKKLRDAPPSSKFMKVKPGIYRYKLGPVMPDGTDANTVPGENIVIYLMKGGWTLDLRSVTFYVDVTPATIHQRPGVMIYVLQSENFTLLGGTIWIDQGEQWTQARCTSVDAASQKATFQVEQGYNVSAWRTAGPRNQFCVDPSDKNHYKFPGCNFWKVQDYNFSGLDSDDKTFTATLLGESNVSEGVVITMQVGPNSMITLSTEDNGGLQVKGLTSNGYFMSIGLNGLVPPKSTNIYYVNPPPRPGFAPRVMGPALSWGNIGGFEYNAPGQAIAQFSDSYWQYTGCPKDLQPGGDDSKPEGL